jgi:hypothetical protein
MKILRISFIISCMVMGMTACTKEGTGGKAEIHGHVKHHEVHIPNAVVYIKYGAKELPANISDYDDEMIASSGDGHYGFNELQRGDYYVYAVGYDSTISETVSGGGPVKIKKKTDKIEFDVAVTE